MTYELLDSGHLQKWERFGPYVLCRPCPQAVWSPLKKIEADAVFSRTEKSRWTFRKALPESWEVSWKGVAFRIAPTEFGHLGMFPEHGALWEEVRTALSSGMKALNLFAYSGGMTLAAAQAGASVCHLDAAKGMVAWAKENSLRNGLAKAPIRWIVDDAVKFLRREASRKSLYEAIILDPPTFGRGAKGEVFRIEEQLPELLSLAKACLSPRPRFLLLSCHTPGFTPLVLEHVLKQQFPKQKVECGEIFLEGDGALSIPSGSYGKVVYED